MYFCEGIFVQDEAFDRRNTFRISRENNKVLNEKTEQKTKRPSKNEIALGLNFFTLNPRAISVLS